MDTRLLEEISSPEIDDGDDENRHAHYCAKSAIVRANVEGGGAKTLCGRNISATRDPQKYPLCPDCKRLMENLKASERGRN